MEEENKVNEENESKNTGKDLSYPSFWGRAGAYILDSLILAPVFVIFYMSLRRMSQDPDMLYPSLIITVAFSFLFYFYMIFFNTKFNGTPGKILCKFRICREDGMPVTWGTALKRESLYIVIFIFGTLLFYKSFLANRAEIDTYAFAMSLHSRRAVLKIYTLAIRIIYIFDFGKAFFSPKRLTLHDQIAGTVVVYRL